ncbi:MAG TPA: hypothetical protein VG326_04920 [Tepidisphaeraceae bacterium]|jgi:hypothetical protein|nr:hypothetical protein [Tepidisphaeraceae bacterium]
MFSAWKSLTILSVLAVALAGCSHDREDYGPGGLSGHDVKAATDQVAADLLADPALNSDTHQWTIVVGTMRDETSDRGFSATDYNIFLARLKTNLFQLSRGRVTLIQNNASFHDMRNQELEGPGGQYAGPPAAAIQPDFELNGVAHDLPNRGSNYYLLEFNLNNLHNRTIVFSKNYEVTVPR